MGAPVTHFEVNVKDGKRAVDFYSNVFGWTMTETGQHNYVMVDTGVKMGINGGIGSMPDSHAPSVMFYVQVENPQAYLDKAVGHGGRIVIPETEVPNMVTYAAFKDPEGNLIGLVKGPQSLPEIARPTQAPKPVKKRKKVARPKRKAKKNKRK